MSATGRVRPADAGLEAVTAWSLRIHEPASEHHSWCLAAARAVIAGAEPPPWPGGRRSTGVARLETITRILDENGALA